MLIRVTPVLFLLLAGCASLPTHHSVSHHAREVMAPDDHGRPKGCSWYCGAPPITVYASSTLRDGIHSYDPQNIHDTKKNTIWAEGAPEYGIGTKIVFTFDCTSPSYDHGLGINKFSLINGCARTRALWSANGRVKTFKVTFNDTPKGSVTVADTAAPQWVKLPNLDFPPGKESQLILEIAEVYPGTTYYDTCISDIVFDGYGVH